MYLEPVAVTGLHAIKHKVVLISIRASASCYSAVMPWAIQECGQATFPNSVSPTRWLSLGCQCQNWTRLDVDSSLLVLGAFKHVQDISSRSVGQFSV